MENKIVEKLRREKRPNETMEWRVSNIEKHNQIRRIESSDGRTYFDTENNQFVIEAGGVRVVEIGNMGDGVYGIKIRNTNGTLMFDFTTENQLIQSADGKMKTDYEAGKMQIYDGTSEVVRLGDL